MERRPAAEEVRRIEPPEYGLAGEVMDMAFEAYLIARKGLFVVSCQSVTYRI